MNQKLLKFMRILVRWNCWLITVCLCANLNVFRVFHLRPYFMNEKRTKTIEPKVEQRLRTAHTHTHTFSGKQMTAFNIPLNIGLWDENRLFFPFKASVQKWSFIRAHRSNCNTCRHLIRANYSRQTSLFLCAFRECVFFCLGK